MRKIADEISALLSKAKEEGLSFEEMKVLARYLVDKKDLRITYGTRTGKWYVIDEKDRDFEVWGIPFRIFIGFRDEREAITYALTPRMIK